MVLVEKDASFHDKNSNRGLHDAIVWLKGIFQKNFYYVHGKSKKESWKLFNIDFGVFLLTTLFSI